MIRLMLISASYFVLALLFTPPLSHAALFFDSDFESCASGTGNDFPCQGWDDLGIEFINAAGHNKIEVTNSLSFSGSKSVKTTFVNNTRVGNISCGIDNPSLYKSNPSTTHLFTRFALRKSPGFILSSNGITKLVRWRAGGSTGSASYPTISVWLQGNPGGTNGSYIIAIEGGYAMGTVNYQGGPAMASTSWDQVETEFQYNTPGQANGLVRLWVNGVLYIERLNLQLIGPTPTSTCCGGLFNPSTATFVETQIFVQCGIGNMWWDRFAVGNTRIGAATASVDTTAPATPTNFSVN